jgi:hypothetical protein
MKAPKSMLHRFVLGSGNRGIATIYIALLLVVLLAFVGLAIDISYKYVAWTQLQNAADAAALAGASRLNVTESYVFDSYTSAVGEATKYAALNKATKESVIISSSLTSSISSNVFVEGNPGNDITFGNWNVNRSPAYIKAGDTGGTPVNAIQVRARRTLDSPGGGISVFFGRLFGWEKMPAVAIATAAPSGFVAAGLVICTQTCSVATPVNLELQEGGSGSMPPSTTGIAWTAFSYTQAPNIGKNGDVVNTIWQRPTANPVPMNVCIPPMCITTNNGVGDALKELSDAFNDVNYDKTHKLIVNNKVQKWTIVVPVVDEDISCLHTAGTACPPGQQGNTNERYHVLKWAVMEIADVVTTGNKKGVLATRIQCAGCINPPIRLENQQSKLVKE